MNIVSDKGMPVLEYGGNVSKKQDVIKLVVFGNPQVGKTSFIDRFCKNIFSDNPTFPFSLQGNPDQLVHKKIIPLSEKSVQLIITEDCADRNRLHNCSEKKFTEADALILVSDATDSASLNKEWVKQAKRYHASCFLVLTKCDDTARKVIEFQDAKQFAELHQLAGVYAVSSKTGENVESAFQNIVRFELDRPGRGEPVSLSSAARVPTESGGY